MKTIITIKEIFWYFKNQYKKYLIHKNPQKLSDILYYDAFHKWINWENPQDLNEKINWLAFNTDTTLWSKCSDKYRVREYIKEKGCEELLTKLYGKYEDADKINFESLPDKFVLKPNHGYGNVYIVKNKSQINSKEIITQLQNAINTPWGYETAEPHYTRIKPCIIAEELLESNDKYGLIDYKIWCFNGTPYYIFTCSNRNLITHQANFNFFDAQWNNLDNYLSPANRNQISIPKPKQLNRMLEYAKILSEPFAQVRVDLYEVNNKIYFGELTFTSNMGRMDYFTKEALLIMGQKIRIK